MLLTAVKENSNFPPADAESREKLTYVYRNADDDE